MDHSFYIDRLSAYSDRELTGEEDEAVRLHVESCAGCQATLAEYEKLEQLVDSNRDLGQSDYWEEAAGKIEARLSSGADAKVTDLSRERTGWVGWKLVSVAATIAVLTFVAFNREDIERKFYPTSPQEPSMLKSPTVRAGKKDETESPHSRGEEPEGRAGAGKAQTDMLVSDADRSDLVLADDESSRVSELPSKVAAVGIEKTESGQRMLKGTISAPSVAGKPGQSGGEAGIEMLDVGAERMGGSRPDSRLSMKKSQAAAVIEEDRQVAPGVGEVVLDELDYPGEQSVSDSVGGLPLEYWQQRRDYLERDPRSQNYSQSEKEKAAHSKSLSAGLAESDTASPRRDRDLLESHYQIGRLTAERAEFDQSLKYLREYLKQPKSPYQSQAAKWLKELEGIRLEKFGDER